MDQDRWKKIDGILQAALELEPAARASYVEQASIGDPLLRAEVMSLLSSEDEALDINNPAFERAACVILADHTEIAEGQVIGQYKIMALLGVPPLRSE